MKQRKNGLQPNSTRVSFWNSIRTKLIVVMMLITSVPLIISSVVSYRSATAKAIADTQESLEWQAEYLQETVSNIIETNFASMKSIAEAPTTIEIIRDPSGETVSREKVMTQLKNVDDFLADGNGTIITGGDGMQVIRSQGDLVNVGDREYFQQGMSGNMYVSDLVINKKTGVRQMSIAVPVYDEGTIIGIVQRNYKLTDLHTILQSKSEDAFVADRNGDILAHSQYDYGEEHEEESRATSEFMTSGLDKGFYVADTGKGYSAYIAYVKEPNTGFTIVTANNSKVVLSSATRSAVITLIVGSIMLILAIVISFIMANSFTSPIKTISDSLSDLSNGRFTQVLGYENRKDEFGQISKATNSVIDTLSSIVSHIKESAARVGNSSEELADMANQISNTTEGVTRAVQQIAGGATQQADEIQSASEDVGKIGNAVQNVQNSSTNLQELTKKMKEASEISNKSLETLQTSSSEMTVKIGNITKAIEATQIAVASINEKVEGISSIASQTNLLSLNASIEAARAGDVGRGFAVVAEEVGNLAVNSRIMTEEIHKEMDVLLKHSNAAVEAAKEVKEGNIVQQAALGETIHSISGMISDINETGEGVWQISQGADTCASSKNTVVDSMSTLLSISEENAASSEETGTSMEELSNTVMTLVDYAGDLRDISKKLNDEMEFFKG